MALILDAFGSTLMDGTEQDFFPQQNGKSQYEVHAFTDNLVAGDELKIRVYILDEQTSQESRYRTQVVRGLQENPAYLFNWIPTTAYRISCQQTSGTFKTITWERWTA